MSDEYRVDLWVEYKALRDWLAGAQTEIAKIQTSLQAGNVRFEAHSEKLDEIEKRTRPLGAAKSMLAVLGSISLIASVATYAARFTTRGDVEGVVLVETRATVATVKELEQGAVETRAALDRAREELHRQDVELEKLRQKVDALTTALSRRAR